MFFSEQALAALQTAKVSVLSALLPPKNFCAGRNTSAGGDNAVVLEDCESHG